MVRTKFFDLPISKRKLLNKFLLVANVESSEKKIHSYLYLETCQKQNAAHTNKYAEKEVARKELITSYCNCSYFLFLFL